MTLLNLIEQANAARPDYFLGSASMNSKVGEVTCFAERLTRNPNSRSKHVRHTFRLNGKVISKAKLQELLS